MSGRHFQQIFMSVLTELQLYKYVFERDFVHTQNKSPKNLNGKVIRCKFIYSRYM